MRKSILTILVAGSAFMLAAAAAGTITQTGPFNPRTGSDTKAQCNLGAITAITHQPTNNASAINGMEYTPSLDGSSAGPSGTACQNKYLWTRIKYTTVPGGLTQSWYFRESAYQDLRGGTVFTNAYSSRADLIASTGINAMLANDNTFDLVDVTFLITDLADPPGF